MDILDQLQRTFAMTTDIVGGITTADLGRPTPCDEWNVGQVLAHTIGVLDAFSSRQPNPGAVVALDDDFHAQFAASSAATLAAWSAPGALDGIVQRNGRPSLPWAVFAEINFVDTFAHAADIAQATWQQDKIDETLAADCLDSARRVIPDGARVIVGFEPARTADPASPASSQLAAFLGR